MVVFKIRDGLYLGSESDALMIDRRRKCSQVISPITHILSITNQPPEWEKACLTGEICTLHIEAKDMPSSDLLQHFEVCVDYIEGARKAGSVLVHCMYGVSRSTTMVAAYLMKSEKLSQAAALESIKAIKPSVKPNWGFMKQLETWEDMKCCIDPQHKSFKSYRLGKMAKVMKEGGRVDLFPSPDPTAGSHDHNITYKCRKCRKLLFTDKDVLPHQLGAGSTAFNHYQQTDTVPNTDIMSLPDTEPNSVSCCQGDVDSIVIVTHQIGQLEIDKTSTTNSAIASSHGVPDECTGATCDDPTTAHHSPPKATPVHCTSLFIDTVEWLSSVVVGTLDGKISCPKCAARLGSFSWAGARCSCGQWVTPSFQVHKSKIDQCLPHQAVTLPHRTEPIT